MAQNTKKNEMFLSFENISHPTRAGHLPFGAIRKNLIHIPHPLSFFLNTSIPTSSTTSRPLRKSSTVGSTSTSGDTP